MNLGHQAVSSADTHLLVCKEWTLFAFGTRGLRPLLCLSKGIDFLCFFFVGPALQKEICYGIRHHKKLKKKVLWVNMWVIS